MIRKFCGSCESVAIVANQKLENVQDGFFRYFIASHYRAPRGTTLRLIGPVGNFVTARLFVT